MFKQMLKVLLMLAVVCGAHAIPFGSSPFDSAQGTVTWWLSGAEAQAATITLPKTGQTKCYDAAGTEITPCTLPAATGQDANKLKGAAWPSPRFTDQGNGTLLDNLTGLIWLKNADCFGTKTWQQALDSANALLGNNTQCSLNDSSVAGQWRLSNRSEMDSLINYQQADGGAWLNGQGFVNAKNGWYWTASSYTPSAADKWIVHTVGLEYASWIGAGVYSLIPVRDFTSIIGSSPVSKDFGSVTTSTTSASQTFTISNSGIDPLTVSSITLTGGDSGMFTLVPGDGTAGTCGATPTIAPAGSCTVSATFTPSSTGAKSTTLRISSNDPVTPNKDIALSGTGAAAAPTTYTIGTGAVGSGTVSCTPATVNSGSTSSCTATATTPGNHISSVAGCGISYSGTGNSDTSKTISTAAITGNCTVTGTFAINSYNVSFTSNGGSAVTSQTINYNATATAPTAPTKTGYTFGGWYSDAALTTAFVFTSAITADTTLYAKWTINSYAVTFTSNGGSAVTSQSVAYNAIATAPATPTKTGYTFGGWYSDSALTTAFVFTTAITADATLYAKWNINSYAVTFTSNGGSAVASQSVAYNATATAPATPTRTGYTFGGWYSDVALTTPFVFTTVITADTTLYAKWNINSYAVTFNSNGGSSVANQSVNYNANATAPTAPTKTGYTFGGWYSDASLTTAFTFTTAITANTTLYAKWNSNLTIADALKTLQAYLGTVTLTPAELAIYDVAPLGAGGLPQGNGVVDGADVIMILRRIIGIGSW
jgi:uncharacterized repeat protein (TIGR02543 family)